MAAPAPRQPPYGQPRQHPPPRQYPPPNPHPPPYPYQQPASAPPPQYQYAGILKRSIAFIIDAIIIIIPLLILAAIFAVIAGIFSWGALIPFGAAFSPFTAILSVLWVLGAFFYFYFFEHRNGETIGKKKQKIRVLREDFRFISKKKAALRSLFRMLYFIQGWGLVFIVIDLILIYVTDKKQRLGDIIAHTIVIKTEGAPQVIAY